MASSVCITPTARACEVRAAWRGQPRGKARGGGQWGRGQPLTPSPSPSGQSRLHGGQLWPERPGVYEFVTPLEEVPRGVLVRGAYVVTSFFTDDDRTPHLSWEWGLHICQDWES